MCWLFRGVSSWKKTVSCIAGHGLLVCCRWLCLQSCSGPPCQAGRLAVGIVNDGCAGRGEPDAHGGWRAVPPGLADGGYGALRPLAVLARQWRVAYAVSRMWLPAMQPVVRRWRFAVCVALVPCRGQALFRPGVHAGGMPRVCRPGMGRPRGRCCAWPGARLRLLVMRIACAGTARLSALPMPADARRRAVCR